MSTTLRQAAESWVAGFSQVPASVIEKMAKVDDAMYWYDSDSLRLAASPYITCGYCQSAYEGALSLEQLEDECAADHGVPCLRCRENLGDDWRHGEPLNAFPSGWSTLFAPDPIDARWILGHAEQVAALGLFVFESEDWGCLLGIDGAGFDFYDAYWIPLYELRGLQWHLG